MIICKQDCDNCEHNDTCEQDEVLFVAKPDAAGWFYLGEWVTDDPEDAI